MTWNHARLLGSAWLVGSLLLQRSAGQEPAAEQPKPVRVDNMRSGHAHPGICVTKSGAVIVVHYGESAGEVLISRSTDGGKTWSKSAPVPGIKDVRTYPGALTTLSDGRVLVTWNSWKFLPDSKTHSGRCPFFAISGDEGKTWSEPKPLLPDPQKSSFSVAESRDTDTLVRHSILELGPNQWLFPLSNQTVVYQVSSGELTPFGDGRKHGLVPIVRTSQGTLISARGLRSTDNGKSWQTIKPFPQRVGGNDSYRYDLIALSNGWLVVAEVDEQKGYLVVSRDDGRCWDLDHPYVYYQPGHGLRSRCNPHLAQLDNDHLGIVFWDAFKGLPGGPGIFVLRLPLSRLQPPGKP